MRAESAGMAATLSGYSCTRAQPQSTTRNQARSPSQPAAGFSLVELVIVVVILSIIAAIAVPRVSRALEKSQHIHIMVFVRDVKSRIDQEYARNGKYPDWVNLGSWFANYQKTRTPFEGYKTGATYLNAPGVTHPGQKALNTSLYPYWYNNANGSFCVRVPPQSTDAETLALYNKLNQSRLTDLSQTAD